jgi:fluoroquinolone resistance protein
MFEEEVYEGEEFANIEAPETHIKKKKFENCEFIECNFSNCDFFGSQFIECRWIECNLSNISVAETSFQKATFNECKLIGVDFQYCMNFLRSFAFHDCNLNFSSFYKLKINKTIFNDCFMHEVDFAEADLSGAVFKGSDLMNAVFDQTILRSGDFRGSFNYQIDPSKNVVRKATFSKDGIAGLLGAFDIIIEP